MPLSQILVTLLMVICTVLIQLVLQIIIDLLTPTPSLQIATTMFRRIAVTVTAVGVITAGLIVQVGIWAVCYWNWGEIGDFTTSLYFALATFTTLGAGELQLSSAHRMVGSIESAVGMIMFGWTTALLVALIRANEQLRREHARRRKHAAHGAASGTPDGT